MVGDVSETIIPGKERRESCKAGSRSFIARDPWPQIGRDLCGDSAGSSNPPESNKLFKQHTLYSGLAEVCITVQSPRAWDLLNKCHIYQYLKQKNIPPTLPQPHETVSLVKSDSIICFFKG